MRRLFLVLLLAGCTKGPRADLQYISAARSLAAEWALVNEQAAKGNVTKTYTRVMRQDLRRKLRTTAASLTEPNSPYGNEIRAILQEPDDASPASLRAHSNRLNRIEDSLESA